TRNSNEMTLELQSFEIDQQISFPKCYVQEHWILNCSKTTDAGPFSCISGGLKFYRRFSYYFLRYYAPSFLTVIIAFCGFWIPVLGWPARVAVIVTPLLTLVTMGNQVNTDINVSYVVALHIWMMFQDLFVFLCLIEYAVAIAFVWYVEDTKAIAAANVCLNHVHKKVDSKLRCRQQQQLSDQKAFLFLTKLISFCKKFLGLLIGGAHR
ncbi:glutamate-gated chloride channel-like protein, partial [Leptotrombidium deliense]